MTARHEAMEISERPDIGEKTPGVGQGRPDATARNRLSRPRILGEIGSSRGSAKTYAMRLPSKLFLIAPATLFLTAFLAVPFMSLVISSFQGNDGQLSLANYREIFSIVAEPTFAKIFATPYLDVLARSLSVALVTTAGVVLFAYPMAYFIAMYGGRYKTVWITLITVPFWTSYLLRIFSWKLILGYNGIINATLLRLGWIAEPLDFLLYNSTAVTIALIHAWMAFAVLPIFISIDRMDRSLLEAATDLGDGPAWRFARVTLPISAPGIVAAALLVFIPTVGDYVTPALLGGPTGTMIGNLIDSLYGRTDNPNLGAAVAMVSLTSITASVGLGALAWWSYRRIRCAAR